MATTSDDDGLSRELSTLSTSSANSRTANENGARLSDTDDSTSDISRQNTSISTSSSNRPSSGPSIRTPTTSRENTLANGIREDKVKSNSESELSRENTEYSREETLTSDSVTRENTKVSVSSDGTIRNESIMSEQNTDISRENTDLSSKNTDNDIPREDTNISKANTENLTRENTNISSAIDYEDDFDDDDEMDGNSREQSFVSQSEGKSEDEKLEKENSVLIERDGKFQLVDEKELTLDQRNILGLNKRPKQKPNGLTVPKSDGRVRKSSNPEFDHLKSSYGMTEQQKEMKIRRISVMQMRKEEEKERMKQEEEEKKIAAEKSFKKWLADKKDHKADTKTSAKKRQPKKSTLKVKKQEEPNEEEDERQTSSDKAFRAWLDEKQEQTKDEKRMERVRLAEEAQNYVIRDRKQCDKAFREWLRKKKIERQETPTQTSRKKSHFTPNAPVTTKKKSLAPIVIPTIDTGESKKPRRPRSSVRATEEKTDSEKEVKRRPKTSRIRITDNYGYRHPASIDDFISRK